MILIRITLLLVLSLLTFSGHSQNIQLRKPIDWSMYSTDSNFAGVFANKDFSFLQEVSCEEIYYISDSLLIKGFLFVPSNTPIPNSLPGIIFNKGGNNGINKLEHQASFMSLVYNAWLASHGYIVIRSEYRGCPDCEGIDEFGGNDLTDVLNLIPILKEESGNKNIPIGMYGISRGSMMTLMSLTRTSEIDCAVCLATPADFFSIANLLPDFEKQVLEAQIPDYKSTRSYALKSRSLSFWYQDLPKTTPILFIHGEQDKRAPFSTLKNTLKNLSDRDNVKLITYPQKGHFLREKSKEAMQECLAWFNYYLIEE